MHKPLIIIVAGFATGLAVSACDFVEPDPQHCARSSGEDICAKRFGSDRPYCTIPSCDPSGEGYGGCVAEEPSPECNYACGGDRNIVEDSSCVEVGDGDGDGDGDPTGDGDGDGDAPCMGPEDCDDPLIPFCDPDSGECVSCDAMAEPDLACAEANDGSTPVCLDGTCVQCAEGKIDACSETTPICDVGASMCVGCSDHSQCPGTACNFVDGNCIDPGALVHVDRDFACDEGDGSESAPYCNIEEALLSIVDEGFIILHAVETDPFIYNESNSVQVSVALFAAPGENPTIQGSGGSPGLTVAASGNLFMRGVTISNTPNATTGQGVRIAGGSAWIEQSSIVNNGGGGIVVEGGGTLVLENSFVGGDVSDKRAIDIADGSAAVTYSTLAAGFGDDTAYALFCTNATNTTVRNSLLVARTGTAELMCGDATVTDSALEMANGDNLPLGDMNTMWFVNFAEGDFSLTAPPGGLDSAATWRIGDPTTDIDGDSRPTTDNTPDYAGADIPD